MLVELLRETAARGGSDLHLTVGVPPFVRVDGNLLRLEERPALTPEIAARLACSPLTTGQRARFDAGEDVDLAFAVPDVARVRCNVFRQRGTVAAVYRLIPERIRPFRELGLPPVLRTLAGLHSGLVLVTGPTGSGKSTTLAAMIDVVNAAGGRHVLTIEDPIEFVHGHKLCVVNQREVRTDTDSFDSALRAVLREDPDVVLIGEMRDAETVEAALRIAETGHLTLATLHTASAVQTVNRIVDVFPAGQQAQVRLQLSMVLEGLVCQMLVPAAAGRRRGWRAVVLVGPPPLRHLFRPALNP
ncbi:MAG: PilT/PilU family type 4a pilus ATPase, partial [Acidobacteria bacterium]|nr:PilT/PilU family type 4a pilus ATPase [Acidobacteriota bacterium]